MPSVNKRGLHRVGEACMACVRVCVRACVRACVSVRFSDRQQLADVGEVITNCSREVHEHEKARAVHESEDS